MTKKKKTFRKFINEEILKIDPPKKGKEFGSFKEFVNDVKGYQPPEKPELQTETFKEFVDKTKGPEKNFVPDYINPTQKQIEEINKRRIIEEINEVLKYRDPVLNKMSFQEWLKIPQNFFVFELSNEQAKRLYEQDMSRVEKYEEINKKSGKGRNKVAVTAAEPEPELDLTIPDLILWLDAKDASTLTISGSNRISEWRDKSGATYTHAGVGDNHHFGQSNSAYQPVYIPAGGGGAFSSKGGAVSIGIVDGSQTYLQSIYNWQSGNSSKHSTMFFVVSRRSEESTHQYVYILTSQPMLQFKNNKFRALWGAAVLDSTTTIVDGTKYLQTLTHKGTGTDDTMRINGTEEDSNDINATLNTSNTFNYIGYPWSSGTPEAEIAEILIYRSILSDSDRDSVESYLMSKWGI